MEGRHPNTALVWRGGNGDEVFVQDHRLLSLKLTRKRKRGEERGEGEIESCSMLFE